LKFCTTFTAKNGLIANAWYGALFPADISCSLRPLLNAQNGMTPLHYAAKGHYLACVKLLVVAGANVNALNVVSNLARLFSTLIRITA
jgi:hypothetical protein